MIYIIARNFIRKKFFTNFATHCLIGEKSFSLVSIIYIVVRRRQQPLPLVIFKYHKNESTFSAKPSAHIVCMLKCCYYCMNIIVVIKYFIIECLLTYVITCMFPEHAVYYVVQSNNLEVKPQDAYCTRLCNGISVSRVLQQTV